MERDEMTYSLRCLFSGDTITDEYTLIHHQEGLLRAVYPEGKLSVREHMHGIWRYADWLPVSGPSNLVAGTISYKSENLAAELGLSDLWITYHGYWPERGGLCPTTSFKDLEAVATLQRLRDHECKGMVCASAGNTGRSFTFFGGEEDFPILVIIAEQHLTRIWVPENHPTDSVTLIGIGDDAGYNDAINVANEVAEKIGWQLEGGARNIARRDGIGSLIIDASVNIGRLPDHYFQAVGGGPGPIGVHEMAVRAHESGSIAGPIPKQHLSQNIEHCPIHNAWQAGRNYLLAKDFADSATPVFSDYLVNTAPAYSVKGGLFDVLTESNGFTWIVTGDEGLAAAKLFEETEGIDIMSPGAVALASLKKAVGSGDVRVDDCVVLNISGGGEKRLFREVQTTIVRPEMIIPKERAVEAIIDFLATKE
jgi:cysteate synthase